MTATQIQRRADRELTQPFPQKPLVEHPDDGFPAFPVGNGFIVCTHIWARASAKFIRLRKDDWLNWFLLIYLNKSSYELQKKNAFG